MSAKIKYIRFISEVNVFCDGGCKGNPGPGAIGVVICDGEDEIDSFGECIGDTTNNKAEYKAIIKGLELAAKHTRGKVNILSDSELVIKQIKGDYRIKAPGFHDLFSKVKDNERAFEEVTYTKVDKENQKIRMCDRLLKEKLSKILK